MSRKTSTIETFQPKLLTALREGYGLDRLRADAIAGLTVAIVALPLSMAIAIASGAGPERGLYTAIIGGFLISALGGSMHQIGGPAGAFIVLVAATIERHGLDGFFLATLIAGLIMIAIGTFRLGTLIRYIPEPVIVGFTAGIAVIIFASQLRDLLGLSLTGREPAALLPKINTLFEAIGTVNLYAVGIALLSGALILGVQRINRALPSLLIAVIVASAVTALFSLPVETIGSRFGAVPSTLPAPALPAFSLAKLQAILPDALTIALLGSIESLLSAVVADSMTGRRHRSNTELIAQGIANIASPLFGGICATGTIARTATNIRAGGTSPVSGMIHSLVLLIAMAVAAPMLAKIPLAALGALLTIVAWNMADRHAFASLLKDRGPEAAVLLTTFLLTVFRDLTEGILVGVVLGAVLFAVRMARLADVTTQTGFFTADAPDGDPVAEGDAGDIIVHRLDGPLFFGTAPNLQEVMARIGHRPRAVILEFSQVPFIDASGVAMLERHFAKMERAGARVYCAAVSPRIGRELDRYDLPESRAPRLPTLEDAYRRAESDIRSS